MESDKENVSCRKKMPEGIAGENVWERIAVTVRNIRTVTADSYDTYQPSMGRNRAEGSAIP